MYDSDDEYSFVILSRSNSFKKVCVAVSLIGNRNENVERKTFRSFAGGKTRNNFFLYFKFIGH
jgi:hypothetical protein